MNRIFIYDTTLRDGSQGEGISFSLQDKLAITLKLDDLGVDYVEGGYPIANPKDETYFHEVKSLRLRHARIAAFGSTRRAGNRVEEDNNVKALLQAETPVVTIVGKSWDFQVRSVLKVSLDENLRMVADTIAYLKSKGKEVFFDAEHFFDGYKKNNEYAVKVLQAAQESGADAWCFVIRMGGACLRK